MSHRAKWLVSSRVSAENHGDGTRFLFLTLPQEMVGYHVRVKTWQVTASSLSISDGFNSATVPTGIMSRDPAVDEESKLYPAGDPMVANSNYLSGLWESGGPYSLGISFSLAAFPPYGVDLSGEPENANSEAIWSPTWYLAARATASTGVGSNFETYASNVEDSLNSLYGPFDETGTVAVTIGTNGPYTLFWGSVYDSFYGGVGTLSGSITVTPYDYWPYADPDGNPIYDITTGDVLPNRDPLN